MRASTSTCTPASTTLEVRLRIVLSPHVIFLVPSIVACDVHDHSTQEHLVHPVSHVLKDIVVHPVSHVLKDVLKDTNAGEWI